MSNFFSHKLRGRSPGEIVGLIIIGVLGITALAILFGFIIMWLWNWLMPMLFGLPTVTYWQGVGLFILFKILFGSCGSSSSKSECKSEKKKDAKSYFSKWKYYHEFWEEEGDMLYHGYVKRRQEEENGKNDATTEEE